MDLEVFMKYLIWIVFFSLAFAGLYLMLKKVGVV